MKRTLTMTGLTLAALFFMCVHAWAVDYSTMTTEELSRLRGSMQTASQADRDAFHAEWLQRVDQMTPDERQHYMGQGTGMGRSGGSGYPGAGNHGNDPGRGSGMGNSGGMGSGNGTGASSGGMGSGRGPGNGGGMGGNSGRGGGMGKGGGGMGRGN